MPDLGQHRGFEKLIKGAENSDQLIIELWDRLGLRAGDSEISPEAVKTLVERDPSLLREAVGGHPDPAVIELLFENPTVDHINAALTNPRLGAEQYEKICRLYDENPRRSIIKNLVEAADGNKTITAEIDPEDLVSLIRSVGRSPRRNLIHQMKRYGTHLLGPAGEVEAARYLDEGRFFEELLDATFGHLSPKTQQAVLDEYSQTSRAKSHLLAGWLASAEGADGEMFRHVTETHLRAYGAQAKATYNSPSIIPFLTSRPANLSLEEAAEISVEVLAAAGYSGIEVKLCQVLTGDRPVEDLEGKVGYPASGLLVECGRYTVDELADAGIVAVGTDEEIEEPHRLLERALTRNFHLEPGQSRRLAEAIETDGVGALIGQMQPKVVLDALSVQRMPLWEDGPTGADVVTGYLHETLGDDPERWRRFIDLAGRLGELNFEDLVFMTVTTTEEE